MVYSNRNIFSSEIEELQDGNKLHLIHIESINSDLEDVINKNIAEICFGDPNRNIDVVKSRMRRLLKEDSNHLMGATAEFFAILYLKELGFKQEFVFINLEENSFKKGFDGYYTIEKEEWILESKSGDIESAGGTHHEKISVAYRGLKNTISGNSGNQNNPWENALFHAKSVDSKKDIKSKLQGLADDFELGVFRDIKDFNIIPTSTIFLGNLWEEIDKVDLTDRIANYFSAKDFNKLNVICINKKSVKTLIDYLNK